MYSSTSLVDQIILDALADWAVQAGRNQINQIFVKYPRFSSNEFIFLTLKPQIKQDRKTFRPSRLRNAGQCWVIWGNAGQSGTMRGNTGQCGAMQGNAGQSRAMWGNPG